MSKINPPFIFPCKIFDIFIYDRKMFFEITLVYYRLYPKLYTVGKYWNEIFSAEKISLNNKLASSPAPVVPPPAAAESVGADGSIVARQCTIADRSAY